MSFSFCSFLFINVHNVAEKHPVGGRLQKFWQVWLSMGSNPRVVSFLQEGHNLPFRMRPALTRSPLVVSGYGNALKNRYPKVVLQSLLKKGSGKGHGSILTSLLQPVIPSSKTSKLVDTYFTPKHLELVSEGGHLHSGNFRNHQALLVASKECGSIPWTSAMLSFTFP